MTNNRDVDELKTKSLCYRCVGEAYLRAEMERDGPLRRCSFCGQKGKSYTVGEMTARIEQVFARYYARTPDQPDSWEQALLSDPESGYTWGLVVSLLFGRSRTRPTCQKRLPKIFKLSWKTSTVISTPRLWVRKLASGRKVTMKKRGPAI